MWQLSSSSMDVLHSVLWKSSRESSLEHFSLRKEAEQYVLEGVVLRSYSEPTRIDYRVTTSLDWYMQNVEVSVISVERKSLELEVTPNQEWLLNGQRLEAFTGLIDIDLGITPSTNTLPIRRLNLQIGEQAELTAVWIRFPELTIEPLSQRYTRLAANIYRYENTDSSFSADLTVGNLGIVKTYGNIWAQATHVLQ
jgi:uncharacterized protein